MAKKEENFDFDTESKGKFDLSFLKNLTKQQKGIILIALVGIVLAVAIVITCVVLGTNNGNGGFLGGNNGGNSNGEGSTVPDELVQMFISSTPKTTYYVGEQADYSGLSVYVVTPDDERATINFAENPEVFTITGFDSSVPVESQIITVECRGLTQTFSIQIKDRDAVSSDLVSIHFGTYPKQIFGAFDKFDYEGGILVCTYADGSEVEIPLDIEYMYGLESIFDITGNYILTPGEHTISVEYSENGIFVQTEYTITVNN